MMNERIIAAQLVAAIHDYLMGRPMCEVEGLVTALRGLKPPKPPTHCKPEIGKKKPNK